MLIIVGFDDTEAARRALVVACDEARAFSGELLLVTSLHGGGKESQEEIDEAEQALREAAEKTRSDAVPCSYQFLFQGRTPGEDLVELARQKGAGRIVIGIERRSKVGKLIFGSNAQHIILGADCPVITVK